MPPTTLALLVALPLLPGCQRPAPAPVPQAAGAESKGGAAREKQTPSSGLKVSKLAVPKRTERPVESPVFTAVEGDAGIAFRYDTGSTGKAMMVEVTGGGAGWLDYDRDGLWDLYLVQGGNPARGPDERNPPNQLYRQRPDRTFVPVEHPALVADEGYGQGLTIGDFDDDGFEDIYVTNVGPNVFYRNQGDGTFEEITAAAGVEDPRWGSSAAWGDLDHDGDLDLFLCNYVLYDPYNPLPCTTPDGKPSTCHPGDLNAVDNECFENLGDGTFRPVASAWGLLGEGSKSLGVVIADLNEDGLVDIFVANDTTANFYYINQGGRRFIENAIPLGCALRGDGQFQASMGVALGDYDRNGFADLYVTHFTEDSNTLYANLGSSGFHDTTQVTGLHQPTLAYLGFGTVMSDFDQNGQDDLFITNGHIEDFRDRGLLFEMPAQLFTYNGSRWIECTDRAGEFFTKSWLGRGVASCDYDDDGDLDLAIVHQNAPAALLRNDSPPRHWLKVRLTGVASNRRGIGARVRLEQGAVTLHQHLPGGTSYLAAHEPTLFFGLADNDGPCSLEILWPSGIVQRVKDVAPNQVIDVREAAEAGRDAVE